MTRPVRFCGLCGGRVPASSPTYDAPIAYCHAHADIAAAGDRLPPDPAGEVESALMLAAEVRRIREDTHPARERGR